MGVKQAVARKNFQREGEYKLKFYLKTKILGFECPKL